MENVLSGLVVAAATGLAVIAYRHPHGYARIFRFLVFGWYISMWTAFVWDSGLNKGASVAKAVVSLDKIQPLDATLDGYQLLSAKSIAICCAIFIYFCILRALPDILASGHERAAGKGEE